MNKTTEQMKRLKAQFGWVLGDKQSLAPSTYEVTALDVSKPSHDLSAYVCYTFDTQKAAKDKIVSLLKAGVYQQIRVKSFDR